MSMKEYVAKSNFTLSVVDPAHSMGLTVKRGETLQYDGYLVLYNGISSGSPSLKAAIREGWLVETNVSEPEAPAAPQKRAQDSSKIISTASVSSGSGQESLVSSKATSAKRGMPVTKMEGKVVRETTFGEKKIEEQERPERKKMGFVRENDQQRVINVHGIAERENRVISRNTEGDVIISARRASVAKESFIVDSEKDPREVERAIPSRRKLVPAKQTLEVTDSTPMSEKAADIQAYKAAGMDHGESELPTKAEMDRAQEKADIEAAAVAKTKAARPVAKKASLLADVVAVSPTGKNKNSRGVKIAQLEQAPIEATLPPPKRRIQSSNPAQDTANNNPPQGPTGLVEKLSVNGEPWTSIHYTKKVEFVKTLKDLNVLKELMIHTSSHPQVRKTAKARVQELTV